MELPSKNNEFSHQEQHSHKALIISLLQNRIHNIERYRRIGKQKSFCWNKRAQKERVK
jgi:hypothetical protein